MSLLLSDDMERFVIQQIISTELQSCSHLEQHIHHSRASRTIRLNALAHAFWVLFTFTLSFSFNIQHIQRYKEVETFKSNCEQFVVYRQQKYMFNNETEVNKNELCDATRTKRRLTDLKRSDRRGRKPIKNIKFTILSLMLRFQSTWSDSIKR